MEERKVVSEEELGQALSEMIEEGPPSEMLLTDENRQEIGEIETLLVALEQAVSEKWDDVLLIWGTEQPFVPLLDVPEGQDPRPVLFDLQAEPFSRIMEASGRIYTLYQQPHLSEVPEVVGLVERLDGLHFNIQRAQRMYSSFIRLPEMHQMMMSQQAMQGVFNGVLNMLNLQQENVLRTLNYSLNDGRLTVKEVDEMAGVIQRLSESHERYLDEQDVPVEVFANSNARMDEVLALYRERALQEEAKRLSADNA